MSVESIVTENLDIWTSAIKTKSSAGRGSSSKLELYGIRKLRELILDLAVRGKLVHQDSSDEPASTLLERAYEQKSKVAQCKKIKSSESVQTIATDEKTFEIPNSWEWVRLGEVVEVLDKLRKPVSKGSRIAGDIPYYGASGVVDYINDYIFDEDIVLVGEDGAKWGSGESTAFRVTGKSWVNNHAHVLRTFQGVVLDDYLVACLTQQDLSKYITGITVPKLNQARLNSIVLPIPPLSEQSRIVNKLMNLMALCDQLESQTEASIEAHQTLVKSLLETLTNAKDADELNESWLRISEHFDVLFTTEDSIDQLKQTILQLAVMGKLVKQDPNEEPASKLLKRIAAEKERLIKNKKIKKQKALPLISEDEKPFQLPRGWEWCRLEDVVDIQSGITKGRKLAGKQVTKVAYLSVANVQRGFLKLEQLKDIEIAVEEVARYEVRAGDLLITEGGDWDKVGRTAIWNGSIPYIAHQNHVFKARKLLDEQNELWLETYLNSPFARDYFAGSSKQTTNLASINKTQLRGCLIAIPPSNHQSEILSSVRSVVELCESLLQKLKSKSKTECSLAELVAHR